MNFRLPFGLGLDPLPLARLNVPSEKALHAAVADMAVEYAKRATSGDLAEASSPRPLPDGRQP